MQIDNALFVDAVVEMKKKNPTKAIQKYGTFQISTKLRTIQTDKNNTLDIDKIDVFV